MAIDPRIHDGCVVKVPVYITSQRGRVCLLPEAPSITVWGDPYMIVRLPDPYAELVLLPAKDLEYIPLHDCPSCKCKYPPSGKIFRSSDGSLNFT